jgi:hypothetical protein
MADQVNVVMFATRRFHRVDKSIHGLRRIPFRGNSLVHLAADTILSGMMMPYLI